MKNFLQLRRVQLENQVLLDSQVNAMLFCQTENVIIEIFTGSPGNKGDSGAQGPKGSQGQQVETFFKAFLFDFV